MQNIRWSEIMNKIKNNQYKLDASLLKKIKEDFISESLTEQETIEVIKNVYEKNNMIIDPHTAIGYGVVNKLGMDKDCVVLSTAHPCKFPVATKKAIAKKQDLPDQLKHILKEKENFDIIENNIRKVKDYIKNKLNLP